MLSVEKIPPTYHARTDWYASDWHRNLVEIFTTKREALKAARRMRAEHTAAERLNVVVSVGWIPKGAGASTVSRVSRIMDWRGDKAAH